MLALVGPTGAGKTQVGMALATVVGAEIICADSMTIWKGLDIGTAKPTALDRQKVPHHLLDVAEPGERPSVASIAALARVAARGIEQSGKKALVVGGSGLYIRAILDGIEFPPTDAAVRAALEQIPPDQAIRTLLERDPEVRTYLDLANRRRVVRALEILELTGRLPSQVRKDWENRADIPILGLQVSDPVLAERIRVRTQQMFEQGWVKECEQLQDAYGRDQVLSTQALGYAQAFEVLDGNLGADQAVEEVTALTIKLVKRQRTWFRADPRIVWVQADQIEAATDAVLKAYDSLEI